MLRIKELCAYGHGPAILALQPKFNDCAQFLVPGKYSSITFQKQLKPRRNTVEVPN